MLNMLSSRDSILAEFPGKRFRKKERGKPWLEKHTQKGGTTHVPR